MATIAYGPPIANVPASITSPSVISFPAASHINDGDFVVLSGVQVATAAANASANIVGIAQHDSAAVFAQDSVVGTDLQGVFGSFSSANPGLAKNTPAEIIIVTLGAPIVVEISLSQTTGWISGGTQQATIGTRVGLGIDTGNTNFFFADPTASNKIATVVEKVAGPNRGVVGDLGARVRVVFDSTALATVQGH